MEQQFPSWQNQPFRLDNEQIADPLSVLAFFFRHNNLPRCRELLWQVQTTAFGGSAAPSWDGEDIAEWVLFHRQLEELIEACYLLGQEHQTTELHSYLSQKKRVISSLS